MDKNICGIYCIENIVNGKNYIGQSKNIKQRWRTHKSALNNNYHNNYILQKEWNEYGEDNFNFYILDECEKHELDSKEIYYIKLFKTFAYDEMSNGYNLSTGGEHFVEVNDFTKQKLRESQKSIPILQINFDGNIVNVWKYGAREASKKLNFSQSCIHACLSGTRKTYKNYIWIKCENYNEDTFDLSYYVDKNNKITHKKIKQYDTYGKLLNIWDSAYIAAKTLNIDVSNIIKVCKRKRKQYNNYFWCYEDDDYIDNDYITRFHEKDCIEVYDIETNNLLGLFKTQSDICKNLMYHHHMLVYA